MGLFSNVVINKNDAVGLPAKNNFIHLDYLVFVDKVGNNTNMKYGKRIEEERMWASSMDTTKEIVIMNNLHYTVLRLTSDIGEAIMCTVVFNGNNIDTYTQIGINVRKLIDEKKEKLWRRKSRPSIIF